MESGLGRRLLGSRGHTIWIVDAYRNDGRKFIVRLDEQLTAFLELDRITNELGVSAVLSDDST
jgi:hypothetical protein